MKPSLKRELQKAFEAPAPTRKKEFLRKMPQTEISNLSFVMIQLRYIPKYIWSIFSVTFGIGIICGFFMEKDVLWIISALIPFIALSVLTENARSDIYLMSELEMTARFSLKSVMLARMGILGVSHLLLLMFLIPLCAVHSLATVVQVGLYILVPYMMTVFIGLWTTRRIHGTESMYACMGIAISVSGMNIFVRRIYPILYEMKYMPIWIIGFVVLIMLAAKEMKKSIEQTEELAWNLS